jgi:signal transduction histidine kinase/CheY-like chemotaxis protein
MRSFSVRGQFMLALVGLNVTAIGLIASFAYRASRESLIAQAVSTAHIVADGREQALTRALERQHDRIRAFVGSVESLCGESVTYRALDFENECVRVALRGFRSAERAAAVELRYRGRRIAVSGPWPKGVTFPEGDQQLAAVAPREAGDVYSMQVGHGAALLRVLYLLGDLTPTLSDRSGLKTRGQLFIVAPDGRVLSHLWGAGTTEDSGQLPEGGRLSRCLTGQASDTRADDRTGAGMIAGFEPVPALGGGCIVAKLDYEEAIAPVVRLARLFQMASAATIIAGAIISFIVARRVTKPIARLAAAARNLETGHFENPVPIGGPWEVRQLGRALSRMARSIEGFVHRAQEARAEAEAANRSKDDFLATLSHELRTPLTAILGWLSIVRQRPNDAARVDHALRVIERNARAEARLIEDLLDVTRIINGQLTLTLTEISPAAVVDAALEAIRPAAELKGVALIKESDGPLAPLAGDAQRLQQIVSNLLANAVRFTPRGGSARISAREVNGAFELRVTDTGVGISPELLPHVFERFRQGETGTMRAHGGLGLGLAIVRHLVELHGGIVRAESEGDDLGATFIVTLPYRSTQAVTKAAAAVSQLRIASSDQLSLDLHGRRIVVVDDDPDAREVLREILEEAGATVATSGSARETRGLMDRIQPDVLIADIGMPEEDGYTLIRSVRAREDGSSRVPAIALTAHARPEDVGRALESGFEIHVAKPVDSVRLLSTIASLLRPAA